MILSSFCLASAWAAPEPVRVGEHTFWLETLDNGLQAIAVADPDAAEASVFVVYSVGNRMETAETHGIAHLTEHIAFSGTAAAPMGALIEQVESLGGEANAYTRDDFTAYYDHRVPAAALPDVLALEADRMRGVVFDADAFAEERRRLAAEESGANQPAVQLRERRRATVYGQQAYGAGTLDDAGNTLAPGLGEDAVRPFYDTWYQPQRAAVVIVGPDQTESLPLISAAFGGIPAGQGTPPHAVPLAASLPEPGEASWETGLTRRRVEWVWAGPSLAEPEDRIALETLAALHGNLLDDEGYPVDVMVDGTVGSSLLVLAATGEHAEETLAGVYEDLRAAEIPAGALRDAQRLMRERFRSRSLHSRPYFSLAVDVAVYARWGLADHPATFDARVDALTVGDLRSAADRWLAPELRWTIVYQPDEGALADLPEDKQGLLDAGTAAMESGDLLRAIAAYERLLALGANPMNTVIYRYTLGDLYFRLRRYEDARRELEAGLAVIDYPALRELLDEVNAAAASGSAAAAPVALDASPAAPESGFKVIDTEGNAPGWAEQASRVMAQLEAWRTLPFRSDLIVSFEESLDDGLAGYYQPETEQLVVGLSNSERFNQGTMLHEMYHALQDQQFDLSRLSDKASSTEQERALAAVIEGEAMLAVAELMDYDFLAHAALPAEGALDAARFESTFRYGDGQLFIRHLREVGGWALVSQALTEPPRTTAEVYHPERYLSGWSPVPPRKLPKLRTAAGEAIVQREPLGEYGLRIFLAGAPENRPLVPTLGAALLGDEHLIVETPEGTRMAWVMAFADAHSAQALAEAAPAAAAAVDAVEGMEVEVLGYVRRAGGYAVRLSWTVSDR